MCEIFYRLIASLGQQIRSLISIYTGILTALRQLCAQSPCYWWCLCCGKWLCWLALVVVAILLFVVILVFVIMFIIFEVTLLVVCEVLCVAIWLGLALGMILRIMLLILTPWNLIGVDWDRIFPKGPRCFAGVRESQPRAPVQNAGALNPPSDTTTGVTPTAAGSSTDQGTTSTTGANEFESIKLIRSTRTRTRPDGSDRTEACGCREGKVGAAIAACALVVWQLAPADLAPSWTTGIPCGIGFIVGGALIGKVLGLIRRGRLGARPRSSRRPAPTIASSA